jgi:hypothetical protein
MFYKILEKYYNLKSKISLQKEEDQNNLLQLGEDVTKRFLDLYDQDVKVIHANQTKIVKDLEILYKETDKLSNTTKQVVETYDGFLEYLKEAGDLVNWCSLIEKEMSEIHDVIAKKRRGEVQIEELEKPSKEVKKEILKEEIREEANEHLYK